jgi:hypothetical protein
MYLMSVSFYPEMKSGVAHILTCMCREWKSEKVYPNRSEAYKALSSVDRGSCSDPYCGDYIAIEPAIYEPEVQLSNSNADELLDYLQISVGGSFEDRCVGSMPAEDMLARVSWALDIAPVNSGLTTMQVDNIVYCGRPSDYIQSKLAQLGEVAQWAKANSRDVVWG